MNTLSFRSFVFHVADYFDQQHAVFRAGRSAIINKVLQSYDQFESLPIHKLKDDMIFFILTSWVPFYIDMNTHKTHELVVTISLLFDYYFVRSSE